MHTVHALRTHMCMLLACLNKDLNYFLPEKCLEVK